LPLVVDLKAAEHGSVAGSNASVGLEESIWLCPIEDRHKVDSVREGMLEGFSLGSYLLLVDYTGTARLCEPLRLPELTSPTPDFHI
jgi:hypothetical protein